MKPSELLRLVWINITQNKFKTIMTSIGIIVGAATIVMVIAIGKGGQEDVADQFKNLNAGAIDISYDSGDKNRGGNQSSDDSSDSGMMMMPSGSGAPSGSSSSPPEEVVDLADNSDLTDKQKLFCVYYVRSFNATKAYMKAYDCDYETAAAAGSRLLKNVKVKAEINNLKQGRFNREMLSEEDIVQKYIDILYADAKDYIDPKRNKINLNNPFADGTLVKKVSFGKTDSVELLDKMKALQWLADHMSLATEKQKAEIELLKAKAEDSSRADEEQLQEKENNVEEILKQLHDVDPDEVME